MKMKSIVAIFTMLSVFAVSAASPFKPLQVLPRGDIYQEGGDLAKALREGFAIVLEVKMGENGKLAEETERTLNLIPGGRKVLVRWRTDDPRSVPLFAEALNRNPALFEKEYIFVAPGPLAQEIGEKFIWPRHMGPYRIAESAAEALDMRRRDEYPIVVRDAPAVHARMCALNSAADSELTAEDRLTRAVGRNFLPAQADISSRASVYSRVAELDAAADSAWRGLKSREEYDAYRKAMHAKMLKAIGPFPEKSPLKFRTLRSFPKDGYRVDHVVYESMPGLVIPGYLFVPTGPKFKAPYAAVVISCGHGEMSYWKYGRACVDVVRRGMAAFVFEAYEQGERTEYTEYNCCQNHTLIGLKAMLLGSSMAMLRIWDGIRAVDCVGTLPFVDKSRIGYMGQSGGGTMTSLMTAADWRLAATAPSGYLTNFGYLCRLMSPQDAEQNIFGQLAFGLNHTGYVLMPDTKVLVTGRFSDFFAYGGTVQLMETVKSVAKMLGESDHYAMNFAPGPHGWTESTLEGSAQWMDAWLNGRKELLPLDGAANRRLDLNCGKVDCGLVGEELTVLGGKSATRFEGARDIHAILRDWFHRDLKARKSRTPDETAALVRRLACIRTPAEAKIVVKEIETEEIGDVTLRRLAFVYPDGLALPAVCLTRKGTAADAPRMLLAGSHGRVAMLDETRSALALGSEVMLLDVQGVGDIGKMVYPYYGAHDTPEEETAIMLYLMGESMVGARATDILAAAEWLKERGRRPIELVAEGSVAIAAAHAFAADRSLFGSVDARNAPPGWTEFLDKPGVPPPYRYTWCVNGALKHYDWKDLLK